METTRLIMPFLTFATWIGGLPLCFLVFYAAYLRTLPSKKVALIRIGFLLWATLVLSLVCYGMSASIQGAAQ